MTAASPILASVNKRAMAALVDAGPLLLLVIFGVALADVAVGGPAAGLLAATLVYVAYHAGFNHAFAGETFGRRMLNIRLVNARADHLSAAQSVVRPIVRAIWYGAFIFPAIGMGEPWLIAVPLLVDLFLVSALSWRRSTADFICRTLVVNSPEVQPHRAPAAPLYSATDAEFGTPPRRIK